MIDIHAGASDFSSFSEIARRKQLCLVVEPQTVATSLALVDLELVRHSISNAVARARAEGRAVLGDRLERLLRYGTATQHVEFAVNAPSPYYFPEDIAKMIEGGPDAAYPFSFQPLSWLRCRPLADGRHAIEEHSIRVCLVEERL
jgi:hypothetical protein